MTRINVVPVEELCDKHLLAEYYELPRVFKLAKVCSDAPKEYTLGKGHLKFFYDKLGYLFWRYIDIRNELLQRKFKINEDKYYSNVEIMGEKYSVCGYIPNEKALEINRARIKERIAAFKRKI